MARERLTDMRVATMKAPAEGRKEFFDTVKTGLCFRVTANGAKSWSVRYRVDGDLRRDTLGTYPQIRLAKARQLAGDVLQLVGEGKDPHDVKAAADAAEAQMGADTIAAVGEKFIAKHAAQRRWGELERVMRRDVMIEWGNRPVASITRREIIDFVDSIVDRGAPVQANRTLVVLKIFFGWCLDRDIIEADPTARVRKPTKEAPRERVLRDDELRAFWIGCDRLGWPFGPLYKLLAITAQRKSEIGTVRWPEINTKDKMIELAGSRYKNERPHLVPLPETALAIIEELPRVGAKSALAFTTNDETPVSGFSKAKAELDSYMLEELRRAAPDPERVELAHWINHDLRRTARTNMSKLKVAPDIGERVLGHTIGGVRGVYDKFAYLDEKRDALDRWAAHLDGIVNPRPDKIVKLTRKGTR